jgi:hypothetical protein
MTRKPVVVEDLQRRKRRFEFHLENHKGTSQSRSSDRPQVQTPLSLHGFGPGD